MLQYHHYIAEKSLEVILHQTKMVMAMWLNFFKPIDTCISYLKQTYRHIYRRHMCFNITSIYVHPLLWMNAMLDLICMVFAEM